MDVAGNSVSGRFLRRGIKIYFGPSPAGSVDSVLKYCGEVLASRRKAKKLTQTQLASMALLYRGFLSAIEQGKQNLSLSALVRLSNALELPLKDLFPDGESPSEAKET